MAANINKLVDPSFARVHYRVMMKNSSPSLVRLVGTYISCIVAVDDSIQHRNHHHITSRNALVVIG